MGGSASLQRGAHFSGASASAGAGSLIIQGASVNFQPMIQGATQVHFVGFKSTPQRSPIFGCASQSASSSAKFPDPADKLFVAAMQPLPHPSFSDSSPPPKTGDGLFLVGEKDNGAQLVSLNGRFYEAEGVHGAPKIAGAHGTSIPVNLVTDITSPGGGVVQHIVPAGYGNLYKLSSVTPGTPSG